LVVVNPKAPFGRNRTLNIERPTSNVQRQELSPFSLLRCSVFDVRCWMFNISFSKRTELTSSD